MRGNRGGNLCVLLQQQTKYRQSKLGPKHSCRFSTTAPPLSICFRRHNAIKGIGRHLAPSVIPYPPDLQRRTNKPNIGKIT